MNKKILLFTLAVLFMPCRDIIADGYRVYDSRDSLIGELRTVRSRHEDTLLDIARKNGLGYHEIRMSNPGVDVWLPGEDREILLPSLFLLPHAPRTGIVLNVPEMRLYYFTNGKDNKFTTVYTYPLGVGREGWSTPYVDTKVIQKNTNPIWFPPESIRREHAEKGDPLPRRVGPGPENPLGAFALRLGLPAYLIHGTNKPAGIGMRVSHGCIRLYPEDIEKLYKAVKLGTPVHIINQPYKIGLHQGKIYLEAHPFLEEDAAMFKDNLTSVVRILIDITNDKNYEVDWVLANRVIKEMTGIPVLIGSISDTPVHSVAESYVKPGGLPLQLDMDLKKAGQ